MKEKEMILFIRNSQTKHKGASFFLADNYTLPGPSLNLSGQ